MGWNQFFDNIFIFDPIRFHEIFYETFKYSLHTSIVIKFEKYLF